MWDIERDGVELVRGLVEEGLLVRLCATCPEGDAGVRDPLQRWPAGREAARTARDLLRSRWGGEPVLTRAILFDKRADANWHLAMHQDLAVAVAERRDVEGFGPWSIKHGRTHVRPPAEVLAAMVTVRLHLDAADVDNGCLRVVTGSHLRGRLDGVSEPQSLASGEAIEAGAGDAVLMKPLVLHGSDRTLTVRHRRVLHMEFAFCPLPAPLAWDPVEIDEGLQCRPS